jgi:RimJ/RimL family protein N-acetyltransferase
MDQQPPNVIESDLEVFFEHQLDPEANHMAAFTSKDPTNRDAFMAHWKKILSDDANIIKTILFGDAVVGNILHFELFGDPSIGYWIGKKFWGKGIATQALLAFLKHIAVRPIYARVVNDNIGSIRVLEKCGFKVSGYDKGFSNARNAEVEELIMKLD